MEKKEITGLSIDDKITKVIFKEIKNLNEFTNSLLSELTLNNINFRMFFQNKDSITFIANNDDVYEIENFISNINNSIGFEFSMNTNLTCITIVGLGFTSSPTLSVAIINLLMQNNITIDQSNATNLSFSLLVNKEVSQKAINLIIEEFNI